METTDYCSYELSLALKEAGFDYPCYFYYTKEDTPDDCVYHTTSEEAPIDYNRSVYAGCSMPLLSQAQKWLREKKGIAINVIAHDGGAYDYDIVFLPNAVDCDYPIDRATFSRTYEEALTEGIKSALELIKKGE